eukprot:354173-Chlamydomonas_euryale.AAC.11
MEVAASRMRATHITRRVLHARLIKRRKARSRGEPAGFHPYAAQRIPALALREPAARNLRRGRTAWLAGTANTALESNDGLSVSEPASCHGLTQADGRRHTPLVAQPPTGSASDGFIPLILHPKRLQAVEKGMGKRKTEKPGPHGPDRAASAEQKPGNKKSKQAKLCGHARRPRRNSCA